MHTRKQVLQLFLSAGLLLAPALSGAVEPAGLQICTDTRNFHDGDTFTCVTEEGAIRVRVAGVDAPEVGQGFWRVSRDLLRSSTPPSSQVNCYKIDRYERQVCRVSAADGRDIALGLVEAGLAWHTVKYRDEQSQAEQASYAAAEQRARSDRTGLWSLSDPQEPGACRALKKQKLKCS